jgi:glycosyltransferase involved in cell wall biosynthesis
MKIKTSLIFFQNFDMLLLTSREDPFPLVCIEVGMMGKPILSFEKATGTNEILKDARGFIVPFGDVDEMANKVILYYLDRKLRFEHGQLNKEIFSQFIPENWCPKLFEVVEKTKSQSIENIKLSDNV